MASVREIYRVENTKTRTIIRVAVLSYFLSAQILQVASVLSGRDSVAQVNSNRKLPENFPQTWRSISQEPESRIWNTSNKNNASEESLFSEPQVMDKPGIFFPDDINPWTPWSACSDDVQARTRGPPEYAKQMRCGHLECVQTRPCRSTPLTRSSQWGGWGQWSECSQDGSRIRVRQCDEQSERSSLISNRVQSYLPTRVYCQGLTYETIPCEVQKKQTESPEWSNWGQWSTCQYGRQVRIRICKLANQCIGARYEAQDCFLPSVNSVDRTWGQQFLCSGTSQYKSRYCGGVPLNNGYQRVRPSQQSLWRK